MSSTGVDSVGQPRGEETVADEPDEVDGSRREDAEILTGRRRYAADRTPQGTLHAAVYRSPHAHAEIVGVDLSRALELDGVVAGFTVEDLPEFVRPLASYPPKSSPATPLQDTTPEVNPLFRSFEHTCLARERVRFVGEPVAVLLAEDRYVAEDGLDLIDAEYDPLPVVLDEVDALAEDAPLLYEEWGTNRSLEFEVEGGDVDAAFEQADHVFEEEIRHHRFTGTPMEPRVVLAEYDPAEAHLGIESPVQTPHTLATVLEYCLDLPSLSVDVYCENIGGGFGQKAGTYPEHLLISALAIHFERPVTWVERRTEHMVSTIHAREQTHQLRVAVDDDGTIRGLEDRIFANSGAAYPTPAGSAHVTTAYFVPGTYTIENYRAELYGVATNKTPVGAHRGFGKAESAFVIERLVKILSTKLDIDPAELRFRNFIQPEQFPYRSATGHNYDSGDYPQALRMALEALDYEAWREEQQRRRDAGARSQIGIGIASCVEPSGAARRDFFATPGYYPMRMRIDTRGQVHVYPEDPDIGTSHEASIIEIVTSELGVEPDDVRVVQGNTEACPYGSGTYSSRFSTVGTTACYECCRRLAEKMREITAAVLDVPASDLVVEDGTVESQSSEASMSIAEVSHVAHHLVGYLPEGMDPGLELTHYAFNPNIDFDLEGTGRACTFSTYPYAADAAVVEVDTGTGDLEILEYVTIHDCGTILKPAVVEGQHAGALAHGFGGALYEELPYDEHGEPQHRTFLDYLVPTANEIPDVTMAHIETPSPFTPGGHKGTGETGTVTPPPTLTNAVEDALAPLGVEIREATPMKPSYIWEKIQEVR